MYSIIAKVKSHGVLSICNHEYLSAKIGAGSQTRCLFVLIPLSYSQLQDGLGTVTNYEVTIQDWTVIACRGTLY